MKPVTFGAKREKPIQASAGPGTYDLDRAEKVTKCRTKSALIGKTSRPNNFRKDNEGSGLGPGTYRGAETNKQFGSDTKKMTIGAKREKRIEPTAGPGEYNW